jgi:hypothetical protein
MGRIIVPLEYFPIQYRKYLDKALEMIPQVSLITEHQKNDNYLFLGLECNDYTDVFMIGSAVGYLELKEAIEGVIPEVNNSIDSHIKQIISPSGN